MRTAAVAAFSLRGVIQLDERAPSQARIPVAAAPAVIAVAMHCMHMVGIYSRAPRTRRNRGRCDRERQHAWQNCLPERRGRRSVRLPFGPALAGFANVWPLALLFAGLGVVVTGLSLRTSVVTGSVAGILGIVAVAVALAALGALMFERRDLSG